MKFNFGDGFVVRVDLLLLARSAIFAAAGWALRWIWIWFSEYGKPGKSKREPMLTTAQKAKREIAFIGILFASLVVGLTTLPLLGLGGNRYDPSAIRGNVRHCMITHFPNYFFVAMDVRLTNPGKPSTAWAWTLRITLPEGQQYEYKALDPLPKPLDLRQKDYAEEPYFMVTRDNYLPNLLLERTVGADHGAFGWIFFPVSNIPASQVGRKGTKFVIEFEQADGTKRTIEYIWEDQSPL